MLPLVLAGCEKDIDIKLAPNEPLVVVEGYINNVYPQYNYVVLSRSQSFFAPDVQGIPLSLANVTITRGQRQATGNIVWDPATRVRLIESDNSGLPSGFNTGVYLDPRIFTRPDSALLGKIGFEYLLEIEAEGRNYSATTSLITPVQVDSINIGYPFVNDLGDSLYRITNNYRDPDTLGNRQFYFWRYSDNKNNFGWGGFTRSRAPGIDDLANGQYIRLTHPQGFSVNDTITYMMASVTREVYYFWDSYNKARDNNGPFSTPVTLEGTVTGSNVTGCFSGLALSVKQKVIER
jgi:hypothetical protein